MNALFETLDEMTVGVRLAESFTASKSFFDPRKMLIAIGFHLNGNGLRRLNSLSKKKELDDPFGSDEFEIIDLEKDYFIVPEYVLENDSLYQELLNKWSESRTEVDLKAFLEFTEINHDKTKQAWRSKTIGSRTDLAIFEKDELNDTDRYHVIAIASESLPYQWIEAFLREVGNGNSVAWYGHNNYSSDHGIMTIVDGKVMAGKTDSIGAVLRSVMNLSGPEDDHRLTIMERGRMESDLEELVNLIRKRPSLSQNDVGERPVDLWIEEIGKLPVDTGADYWRLADLTDRVLNTLNTQSQFNRLTRSLMVMKDKIRQTNKTIFEKAYQDAITERGQLLKERHEEFTPSSKDYATWRFFVMHGSKGVEALDQILDKRDEELEFARTMNSNKTIEETASKTAKAREIIDKIAEKEEADLRGYIEEAEASAFGKGLSMDYAGALIFLEKLFGEYAKETLEELVERDKEDEDFKLSYLEVASLALKPTNLHKVNLDEVGSFYLWLNTTRHELKKDK